jgi:acyl-CoA synthetase (AMP-forming)/AMP-acid ligase II
VAGLAPSLPCCRRYSTIGGPRNLLRSRDDHRDEVARTVTVEYLRYYAVERPDSVALITGDRTVTYGEFGRDLWKFARALQAFGLQRGQSVAIGCDDFYVHWLLILACEQLGVASASFQAKEGRAALPLLGSVDLVLAEPHYPPGGWNTKAITPDWVASVFAGPDEGPLPETPRDPKDIIRINRTSGTTGDAKRIHQPRALVEARQGRVLWLYRESPSGGSLLLNLPLSISGTILTASWSIRTGYTLVHHKAASMAELPPLIRQYKVARISLLPVQLEEMLGHLPADWVKPDYLEVVGFGAPVSEPLRQRSLDRLATVVTEVYGANEGGVVSVIRRTGMDGFGTILPGVELDIVDEADMRLPDGTPGIIRYRSPSVFSGYVDDPALTRRMLRDGWFYPGDIGIRQGSLLKVTGRVDDQVNVGGVKYPLTKIEEAARRSGGGGVTDAGAVAIANAAGVPEIHVALVTDGVDDRALLERVIGALRPVISGGLHFTRLPQIPRNDMGKIDRALLRDAIVAVPPSR